MSNNSLESLFRFGNTLWQNTVLRHAAVSMGILLCAATALTMASMSSFTSLGMSLSSFTSLDMSLSSGSAHTRMSVRVERCRSSSSRSSSSWSSSSSSSSSSSPPPSSSQLLDQSVRFKINSDSHSFLVFRSKMKIMLPLSVDVPAAAESVEVAVSTPPSTGAAPSTLTWLS
jgi:uncharacterized membrane protein YgcG